MSSITAQQAKLDLELVPKEKDVPEVYMHQFWDSIHKHNTSYMFKMDKKKKFCLSLETFRIHSQDFDELPTDEVFVSFFKELGHTRKIKSITDEDFTYQINNKGHKKQEKIYYLQFTRVIIDYFFTKDKTVSKRKKIGMHTSRDDYLINTLRLVFANKVSQIYGARHPESMTSPDMRETKAYKTYLGYATGVTPPKKVRKFKKPASPKLMTVPASPKEPTKKSKRVKRPAKKSTNAPTPGVVIRDTPGVSVSKKKASAKADIGKGIELLLDATLLQEAQLKKTLKKNNEDDNESDDNNDEDSENDDDDGNYAQDSKRTNSDEEENPNLNLNIDEE
nr:hypothetical protein [Tanacetum cinerariifolium]